MTREQASKEDIHREREQAYMRGYEDGSRKYRIEPCEDAISRQAAIDIVICDVLSAAIIYGRTEEGMSARKAIVNGLKRLPSVSTEKTGRWEWVQYDGNPNIGNWHCSECNRIVCGAIIAANPVCAYKYCPNCGAKMGASV